LVDQHKEARRNFKVALKAGGEVSRAAELGIALLDLDAGPDDDALQVLRQVAMGAGPSSMEAERYAHLALEAGRNDHATDAGTYTRRALDHAAGQPDVEQRVRKVLEKGLGKPIAAESKPANLVEALDGAVLAKDRAKVESLTADLRGQAPAGSDEAALAEYALRRLETAPPAPGRVALLLPTTGNFRSVGAQVKQAFELGWSSGGGATSQITVFDTGETEASALLAAEKAALSNAVALAGPLRTEEAAAAARVAQAFRVPLVGLHQDPAANDGRSWVYDGIATPESQVRALLDHVMGVRGMKAFAIFAPDNAYGRSAADIFQREVERRGGTVTVRELYDAEATDLVPFAKKLGRKDYTARAAEFSKVKSEVAKAGGDPRRAVLPPILDFDAIFLPDNRRRIPVAAAGLAYEEFPIGQFQIKKGGRTIPLLGLSGWNHPELVTSGGPYVRDSVFVDVFLPDEDVAAFIQDFSAQAGREPNTLEAQAWSVGKLLASALSKAPTREAALRGMQEADLPPTATGTTGVDPERGEVLHHFHVLTLNKYGIRKVAPPQNVVPTPESPAPAQPDTAPGPTPR
jgi:ABC-type branched-subunit amino acid transport system substrate-binding protein